MASHSSLQSWALPQLSKLLPLDEESLKQIITYTDTLPRDLAADHLKNLLGDSGQALEFISAFNTRRPTPPNEIVPSTTTRDAVQSQSQQSSQSEVPQQRKNKKKTKQPFNKLPSPRQPDQYGDTTGGYMKKAEDNDYMSGSSTRKFEKKIPPLANALALQDEPDAIKLPTVSTSSTNRKASPSSGLPTRTQQPKLPPSAAGTLISDLSAPSRSASPAQKVKTKVNVTGGLSMRGQSSTINDLDSAIRSLEMATNPTLATRADNNRRRCNCMAQRHALLTAAPNCLNCGKIICAKEGLGPCTFCEQPLLSNTDLQAMMKVLREERGKEKMAHNNSSHKKAEVAKVPRAFSNLSTPVSSSAPSSAPSSDSESDVLIAAKKHRDKLLKFQAENAKRTHIHDEAADFETPDAGLSHWASPQERALQLKRQQKVLREQEWNAKPEHEKRRMVMSIDVSGGKAVRRIAPIEMPEYPISDEDDADVNVPEVNPQPSNGSGTFSKNPLVGNLIKPVWTATDNGKARSVEKISKWRRVQDDNDDNEQWILDGGAYGGMVDGRVLGSDEPACG